MRNHKTQWRHANRRNWIALTSCARRRSIGASQAGIEGANPRFMVLAAALLLIIGSPHFVAALPVPNQRSDPGNRPQWQLVTPAATPVPSRCVGGENLIPNGGFESGEENWFVQGAVEVTTTPSQTHSGNSALRLGAPEAGGYIDWRVSPVVPGATYELVGWGKLSAGGESAEIGVQFYDGNGERLTGEEPAPLSYSSTTFVLESLRFTVPSQVANLYVYVAKGEGAAQFSVDTLSLTVCQTPGDLEATPVATPALATPVIAPPEEQAATPVPTAIATATTTPQAQNATPTTLDVLPLTVFFDSAAGLYVSHPADWRRLTEREIRAQIGSTDERAADEALTSTQFVVVSPDGLATIVYTRLPRPEGASLDDVVSEVAEANAASVSGIGEISTEPLSLDGVDAVRLRFSASDPATGTADARVIRQLVTTRDDWTVVLTAILQADAVSTFEETLQLVEESWRWRSQP